MFFGEFYKGTIFGILFGKADDPDIKIWRFTVKKLEIEKPTEFRHVQIAIMDINVDNHIVYNSKSYIDHVRVDIHFPPGTMKVNFSAHGKSFKPIGESPPAAQGIIKKEATSLLFAEQEYTLSAQPKR